MASVPTRRHRAANVTNRGRLAADLAHAIDGEVRFDESSFEASPAHRVPGPVGKAAAKIADRLKGD